MSVYADLAAFTALPRLTGLALSLDGSRLVCTLQQPDRDRARYTSSLWEIPLDGGEPVRLTRSAEGESDPAFLPDGSLLFVSERPSPEADDDDAALWVLPDTGEPTVLARGPGGLSGPLVAGGCGTVVVAGSRLTGPDGGTEEDADDAARRKNRQERKVGAVWHSWMPIRAWDHEVGHESPRLFAVEEEGQLRDLAPDAGLALLDGESSISADGATLATTWREPGAGGAFPHSVVLVDVATGKRTVLAGATADGAHHTGPRISPDGSRVALQTETDGSFDVVATWRLRIVPVDRGADGSADVGADVEVELGDVHPAEWAWSADSATLFVAGDWHGRGAVLAVDPATGSARRLACDAAYSRLCPSPDGRWVYALRSAVDAAPTPVRLDTAAEDQTPEYLPTPAPMPPLPGRMEEVQTEVDGATVRGWLCLPEGLPRAGGPAPLMQWIHGGPFVSYNDWTWRWNPWVAVAHGWAVLMPDPALSTGYGSDWIARAWPHRAARVWADVEGLLDVVLTRPDVDETRTALLGASFGGYMTNWLAGHTDRFGAIVTHAGLWALDQQHDTTDGAHWKNTLFGEPDEHPDWYAENSPHHFVDRIVTPMLITHGNRDYRVPVSEGLRLWWDLVRRWTGEPADLPHRFLQFTDENHWILSPANSEVWYDAVLGFCAHHVLGADWTPTGM